MDSGEPEQVNLIQYLESHMLNLISQINQTVEETRQAKSTDHEKLQKRIVRLKTAKIGMATLLRAARRNDYSTLQSDLC